MVRDSEVVSCDFRKKGEEIRGDGTSTGVLRAENRRTSGTLRSSTGPCWLTTTRSQHALLSLQALPFARDIRRLERGKALLLRASD
jgi:hypothetical protein